MKYSLYEYYISSHYSSGQIFHHYISEFYCKRYNEDKFNRVTNRVFCSIKLDHLCKLSSSRKIAPKSKDFISCINSDLWFTFKSKRTKVMATLIAIDYWDKSVNSVLNLKPQKYVTNLFLDILNISNLKEKMTEDCFYEFVDKQNDALHDFLSPVNIEKEEYDKLSPVYSLDDFEATYGTLSVSGVFEAATGSRYICSTKDKEGKPHYVEFSKEIGNLNKQQFNDLRATNKALYIGKLPTGKYLLFEK